jgi:hypothetical protein
MTDNATEKTQEPVEEASTELTPEQLNEASGGGGTGSTVGGPRVPPAHEPGG